MWTFLLLFFFNILVRAIAANFQDEMNTYIIWINEQLTIIKKNENVEKEKINWIETNYLPQIELWKRLTGDPTTICLGLAQASIYTAGILAWFNEQSIIANTVAAIINAGVFVILINISQKNRQAVQMVRNVNDLTIESMGLKETEKKQKRILSHDRYNNSY